MVNLLAIDPSTNAGWALRLDDGKIFYGSWKLKKPTEKIMNGYVYIRYGQAISQTLKDHGVSPNQCRIAIEGESYNSIGTEQSKDLRAGWFNILDFWCAWKGAISLVKCPPMAWRKAFIQATQAPKEIKDPDDRREWIKTRVISECEKRGWKPKNDNEADALGILLWFYNGGDTVQETRKANKKAKTVAKRAQTRIKL